MRIAKFFCWAVATLSVVAPAMADPIDVADRRNIIFMHPDLGIGGAERLIIDAAVGLQNLGHNVTIFTSYCSPDHSFRETQDGTLDVRVRGDTLFPPSIGSRLSILFSILRQTSLIVSTSVFTKEFQALKPDIFFVDQLSAGIPLLRFLFPHSRMMFYGHYPDQLLLRHFGSGFMRYVRIVWRVPFDIIESWSTSAADVIMCNSNFTRGIFMKTLPGLRDRELRVIYPAANTNDKALLEAGEKVFPNKTLFLSINRFECKKDIELAIKAYAGLTVEERERSKLVLAGGYDPRNPENEECYGIVKNLTDSFHITHATYKKDELKLDELASDQADVFFLLSVSNDVKVRLLTTASILLYTPTNEHFGIVPVEAMVAAVPVLATDTGGPLESVVDGETGWSRSASNVDGWTEVLSKALAPGGEELLKQMGQAGRERAKAMFSREEMAADINEEIQKLSQRAKDGLPRPALFPAWLMLSMLAVLIAFGAMTALAFKRAPALHDVQTGYEPVGQDDIELHEIVLAGPSSLASSSSSSASSPPPPSSQLRKGKND